MSIYSEFNNQPIKSEKDIIKDLDAKYTTACANKIEEHIKNKNIVLYNTSSNSTQIEPIGYRRIGNKIEILATDMDNCIQIYFISDASFLMSTGEVATVISESMYTYWQAYVKISYNPDQTRSIINFINKICDCKKDKPFIECNKIT